VTSRTAASSTASGTACPSGPGSSTDAAPSGESTVRSRVCFTNATTAAGGLGFMQQTC
jgi:hypothetical protein